jgi:hypothetical protein
MTCARGFELGALRRGEKQAPWIGRCGEGRTGASQEHDKGQDGDGRASLMHP